MNKFYTNVERMGNDILVRGYHSNGTPFLIKERFKPKLYLVNKASSGAYKSLGSNKPLLEKPFSSMSECRDFIEQYKSVYGMELYGNTNFVAQYIHNEYPETIDFNFNKIHIFMFDIEVDISKGKPNMSTADKPITSIAIKSSKKNEYVLLGLKDYDKTKTETGIPHDKIRFEKFDSEKNMLSYFIKLWVSDYPEIVTGWNVEYFDIQYIITRIGRIFGEDYMKKMSPWNIIRQTSKEMYGKEQFTYHIYGISIIDYMDTFKKYGYKYGTQETYKLDHIAHVVLGERKLSYEEYGNLTALYELNPQKYLDYNLKDTYLIERFEQETALLVLVVTVAYDGGVNFRDAFGTVGIWDTILYRRLMNKKEVPPIKGSPGDRSDDLVGGFVKEPKPGKYRWVVSFDLNSLYPHLMIQYNMSPETIIKGGDLNTLITEIIKNVSGKEYEQKVLDYIKSGRYEEIYNNITDIFIGGKLTEEDMKMFKLCNKNHKYSICANGVLFTNEFEGMIPQIINEKYGERKIVKNKMLDIENEIEQLKHKIETDIKARKELESVLQHKKVEAIQHHNKQMSIKILMNSLYGATANVYFIYYIMEMAEAITKSGQLSVQWSAMYINRYINKVLKTKNVDYVVYIDTDSVYINFEPLIIHFFGNSNISTEEGEMFLDTICKEKIEKVIDESYKDLAELLGSYKNAMKMKREKINDNSLFVAKKRYVLNTLNSEGVKYDPPKVSVTGMESVRSSTPETCREMLKKSFQIVMTSSEEQTQKFIEEYKKQFFGMDAAKIAKNSGTDSIEKYMEGDSYKKGCPAHVRGCIIYNNLLKTSGLDNKYSFIQSGDKVKTVYLKMPNPTRENLISFPEILPKEFGLDNYIDYDTQFEKVFLSPMESLLNVIGWKTEKIDSILDMFE